MKLTEIRLLANFNKSADKIFNIESTSIAELFWSKLAEENLKLKKCNIFVCDSEKEVLESGYRNYGGIAWIYVFLDINSYMVQTGIEKKRLLLDLLKAGMTKIFEYENLDKSIVDHAYEACVADNYIYSFLVKDKFKASPDRKKRVGFIFEWELEYCKIFTVLCYKDEEIKRELFMDLEPHEGYLVYYLDWKWINNESIVVTDTRYSQNSRSWSFKVVDELPL